MSRQSKPGKEVAKTVVGYELSGGDNDTEMYDRDDMSITRCPRCGIRLDFAAFNPDYALSKTFRPLATNIVVSPKHALSFTYDNQAIVTREFRQFCLEQGYPGLVLREFPKDPLHFQFLVTTEVIFDLVGGKVQFIDYCPACGNHAAVIKGGPECLKVEQPLSDGFYRTDLLFGSYEAKAPLIIVGSETRDKLKAAKLKGLYFHPVYRVEE